MKFDGAARFSDVPTPEKTVPKRHTQESRFMSMVPFVGSRRKLSDPVCIMQQAEEIQAYRDAYGTDYDFGITVCCKKAILTAISSGQEAPPILEPDEVTAPKILL